MLTSTFLLCPMQASQMCGTAPRAVALHHHLYLLPSEGSQNFCHGKVPRVGDDWRRLFWEGVQGSEKIQRSGGKQRGISLGWDSAPPTPVENGAGREAFIPTCIPKALTPSYFLWSLSSEIGLRGFIS